MSNRMTKLVTAAFLIGAPACGNTMGKGGDKGDCTADLERTRAEHERPAAHAMTKRVTKLFAVVAPTTSPEAFSLTALVARLVQPRTMPSGAPACGNVASRAPQPADCSGRRP